MDPFTAIVVGLSLMVIVVVSIVMYTNTTTTQKDLDQKMKSVVDQINNSQHYAYKFDQGQQGSIAKVDKKVQDVNDRVTEANTLIQRNKKQTDSAISNIERDFIRKDALPKGVPYIKAGRLQLGEELVMGAGSDGNIGVYDKSGARLAGGLSARNIVSYSNATMSNLTANNTVIVNSLAVRSTPTSTLQTIFRAGSSNTIHGSTDVLGALSTSGNIVAGSNMTVQGRIHFRDTSFSTTQSTANNDDTYYLEKVLSGNNSSSLRLTINNDSNESLQIWGNACGTGNCTSQGTMAHTFTANGNTIHRGNLEAANITATNMLAASNDAWLSSDGRGFVRNKLGVGLPPNRTTPQTLTVTTGTPGQFNTLLDHGQSTVKFAKDNGEAMRIDTMSANAQTSAVSVYSAAGELFDIRNNGRISMGVQGTTDPVLIRNNDLKVGRNVDAWDRGAGTNNSDLFLGSQSGKVVVGNNTQSGQAYARDMAPNKDAVVVTNPLYVHRTLKVNRSATDALPTGWNGGIHTSQIFANGTIAVGDASGAQRAYIDASGSIFGNLQTQSSDRRLKDEIKPINDEEKQSLSKLKPVSYTMKTDPHKTKRFGFISQEVEKVYPNMVYESRDGTQALDYTGFIPLVVDRVNDLSKVVPNDQQLCIGKTCVTEQDLKKLKGI